MEGVLTSFFHHVIGHFGNLQKRFFIMASRVSFGEFKFGSIIIDETNFPSIYYKPDIRDLSNHNCLTAMKNETSMKLNVFITDCMEQHLIICRKVLLMKPNCSAMSTFTKKAPFSILLNQDLKSDFQKSVAYKKAKTMDMINRVNISEAYRSIFQSLWYSFIPCFDVRNISRQVYEMSLLRYCEWKGIPISCSAIFTTFPTDQGLCCSFNMKAADEIFIATKYRETLQEMQISDKDSAFLSSNVPTILTQNIEPQAGSQKGLMVLLDSHYDWLVPGTFDEDFHAFTAVIQSSGSFPLIGQGGLLIRPGYNNIITLSSTKIDADDSIRSLNKRDRDCMFPEENSELILHKKYSFFNCKFECTLRYAMNKVESKYGTLCFPWYIPPPNDSIAMCDPWTSSDFFQIMTEEIPDSLCSYCLRDCDSTLYEPTINMVPFEKCDASNLGVSQFCQVDAKLQQPMLASVYTQITKEFVNVDNGYYASSNIPEYILSFNTKTRIRSKGYNIFKKNQETYNAYDRDFAMVEIIFPKSTVLQINNQLAMTWTDYFSAVGGLLGLVLGMGFVSFFELLWLSLRIISKRLKLTDWIA
jgi:hypothetical protein